MGAYFWVLIGGAAALLAVGYLKYRLVGFGRRIPRVVRIVGLAMVVAAVAVPYYLEVPGHAQDIAMHGFPFLLFGQDVVGRVFSGPLSIAGLIGDYLLWVWLAQLVFLRQVLKFSSGTAPVED